MDTKVEDLLSGRMTVYEVVCGYDFLVPWAFERTPASSEDLQESYLRPVEECDLFILIIGAQVTEPVIAECLRAKEQDKHILVFVKKVERRSQAVQLLLKQIDKKYAPFGSPEELTQQVKDAIDQLSSLSLRSPRRKSEPPSILHHLHRFIGTSDRFRVTPIIPRYSSEDIFLVRAADEKTTDLYKSGVQEDVSVPTNRITEILDTGSNSPKTIVLNGRLQHITPTWRWKFFEEKPDPASEHGFAKRSHPQDPEVRELIKRLAGRFDFYWGAVDEIPMYIQKGWVVSYLGDGRYFLIPDRLRDTILMARRKQ
jgi:hypothetical protein